MRPLFAFARLARIALSGDVALTRQARVLAYGVRNPQWIKHGLALLEGVDAEKNNPHAVEKNWQKGDLEITSHTHGRIRDRYGCSTSVKYKGEVVLSAYHSLEDVWGEGSYGLPAFKGRSPICRGSIVQDMEWKVALNNAYRAQRQEVKQQARTEAKQRFSRVMQLLK